MSPNAIDFDVVIIGGGAAGFFTAINLAEQRPDYRIVILERGKEVLGKVRISGGGRCNVTHASFVPNELVKNYPRGEKELRGPFHTFCTGDTIEFFEKRGVALKIEDDGRMFPVTDSSETIIDCFLSEADKSGVKIYTGFAVTDFCNEAGQWIVKNKTTTLKAHKLIICTGSNPKIWKLLQTMGHQIITPVPSLFTFNCRDVRIKGLAGISTLATIKLKGKNSTNKGFLETEGPLLITHWGFSGPAILKLSAWGARELASCKYKFCLKINWLPGANQQDCQSDLEKTRLKHSKKTVQNHRPFDLPKRLWLALLNYCEIPLQKQWAAISKKEIVNLANELTQSTFNINGKSTFKEEFVTAGGVALKEIDFKTYESRILPGLYFAGEVMNIDAVTGGFNFQNAWTGAFIAAKAIAENK